MQGYTAAMINSIRTVSKQDAAHQIIRGVRSLANVDLLTEILCNRHKLTAKHRANAKLQAQAIRSCLEQAMEYREAAIKSDYARPTLVYYSMMSFALCEILLKRDGNYRLEKLRQQHAHHGLDFVLSLNKRIENRSANDLFAKQLDRGTFSVWFESSRHRPFWGNVIRIDKYGQTSGIEILGTVEDGAPAKFSKISLQRLAENCPSLFFEQNDLGINTTLIRATLSSEVHLLKNQSTFKLIIHPAPQHLVDAALEQATFHPRCVDLVKPFAFESGGGFSIAYDTTSDHTSFKISNGYCNNGKVAFLNTDDLDLNEFGIYYVASYIGGMFARYYPEIWEKCSDNRTQLYLLTDAMMTSAIERSPMLLLEEFRSEAFVID